MYSTHPLDILEHMSNNRQARHGQTCFESAAGACLHQGDAFLASSKPREVSDGSNNSCIAKRSQSRKHGKPGGSCRARPAVASR